MKTSTTKRIAVLALFTAASLIMFLIESQFPPLFFPGAKMGLSNLFSMLALVLYGPGSAFVVIVCRTLLGSLFSNVSTLLYSFNAGIAAIALSSVLVKFVFPAISLLSVSVAAAVFHNIVQNFVFVLVTKTPQVFTYLPYLAVAGVLSGLIVGAVLLLLIKKIPLSVYRRVID